jgi:hypothetical protein
LRVAPLIVFLTPIIVVACEDDDKPPDCTDQGGVCAVSFGSSDENVFVSCEGSYLLTEQCKQTGRRSGSCCRPKKCAVGRGICTTPCASGRRIYPQDSDCADSAGALTDCCEP